MPTPADVVIERLLDRAVARALADSPRATALIEGLRGRRLAIEVRGTPWHAVIESTGRTLKLLRPRTESQADAGPDARPDSHPDTHADATIVGAPLSLLALTGDDPQAVIRRGDARIEGDPEIAQQFRELGLLLRPDLEAGMAQLVGRSGAHIAMRGLRAAAEWTRTAAWTQVRNTAEYLAHESADLVSRPESEHYLRDVDQLREQLDRIEARLQVIERRAATPAGAAASAPTASPSS
jgi:ubiquinone biosynthesis protein UbiJ